MATGMNVILIDAFHFEYFIMAKNFNYLMADSSIFIPTVAE
jgi:hypothetical protein